MEVIIYISLALIFFINFMNTMEIKKAFDIQKSVSNRFKETKLLDSERYFPYIRDKYDLTFFISDVYYYQILFEEVKEFPNQGSLYHFVNNWNFFAGSRITFNRAILETKEIQVDGKKAEVSVRKSNYQGEANDKYKSKYTVKLIILDVQTEDFGKYKIPYSSTGGHGGNGGYVYYIHANTTFWSFFDYYDQLYADGLYDSGLISIILESIFYNENFQTGVLLTYQFISKIKMLILL
jgi:hypothetical protein